MNLSKRRRRPDAPEVVEDVEDVETVEDIETVDTVAAVEEPDSDESPTVRALRAQVRALEQALEVAPDVPAPSDDAAAYRDRVLLAVRAVGSRADDHDDPRHVAARVLAAVERLEVVGFTRTVLPGTASARAIAPPPPLPAAAQEPALQASPETEPVEPAEAAEEVVLPVPPPADDAPRRGRRRLRHPAA